MSNLQKLPSKLAKQVSTPVSTEQAAPKKLTAIGNNLVVTDVENEAKEISRGGIIVIENDFQKSRSKRVTIVSVGPAVKLPVKVGDVALVDRSAGQYRQIDDLAGNRCYIMKENDLIALV